MHFSRRYFLSVAAGSLIARMNLPVETRMSSRESRRIQPKQTSERPADEPETRPQCAKVVRTGETARMVAGRCRILDPLCRLERGTRERQSTKAMRDRSSQEAGMQQWVDVIPVGAEIQEPIVGTGIPLSLLNMSFEAVSNTSHPLDILKIVTKIGMWAYEWEVFTIDTNITLAPQQDRTVDLAATASEGAANKPMVRTGRCKAMKHGDLLCSECDGADEVGEADRNDDESGRSPKADLGQSVGLGVRAIGPWNACGFRFGVNPIGAVPDEAQREDGERVDRVPARSDCQSRPR